MSRRIKFAALGTVVFGVVVITAFLLWPRFKLASLDKQLQAAQAPGHVVAVVRDLLELDSDAARAVVARFAAESPLRAFDSDHRIFVLHDAATGRTHEVVMAPQGSVVVQGTGLARADQQSIKRAVQAAVPRISSESFTFGEPPTILAGVHCLGKKQDGEEQATFILRERDRPRYHALVFRFAAGRLISEGLEDISEAELAQLRNEASWPQGWGK